MHVSLKAHREATFNQRQGKHNMRRHEPRLHMHSGANKCLSDLCMNMERLDLSDDKVMRIAATAEGVLSPFSNRHYHQVKVLLTDRLTN